MTHSSPIDTGGALAARGGEATVPPAGDAAPVRRPAGNRTTLAARIAAAAAVVTVFLVHFRPWQEGLLEDWSLALAWENEGIGGLTARIPAMAGRPLHLVPQYLGFLISDGGFVGPYGVLAVVAVGQLLLAVWALRPLISSPVTRWVLGVAIALHPWWVAGDILRFLPAQVSVLAFVLWLGAAIRFLGGGRRLWVLMGPLAMVIGLLGYQALAAAVVVAAAVLALTIPSGSRRRLILVTATAAASSAVIVWSAVIAPVLSPASYEAGISASSIDIVASVRAVLRTLLFGSPGVVVLAASVALLLFGLALGARVTPLVGWTLLAGLGAAPAVSLVYASVSLHLHDPERLGLPVGVTVWVVLCCTVSLLRRNSRMERATMAVLLVGTALGASVGYSTWTSYAGDQQGLLTAVDGVREGAAPGATLVVADLTGRYGDVYTLLPPHLDFALLVTEGPGAAAILCTPAGVVRDQPVALEFPIATTPDCEPLLAAGTIIGQRDVETPEGTVRIFELAPVP